MSAFIPMSEHLLDFYGRAYDEAGRVDDAPKNRLMALRTRELFTRFLPPPPAVVADVGGGPGVHARWLAERGYEVHLVDVVPEHVTAANDGGSLASTTVGDARALHLDDTSCDAVLLMGPMYHLLTEEDRLLALTEARRVLRPDGVLLAEAITRTSAMINALHTDALTPALVDVADRVLAHGVLDPTVTGNFTDAFVHEPVALGQEVAAAGFDLDGVLTVEGAAWTFGDLQARLDDPVECALLLDVTRRLERVPELLGHTPHVMAIATRPSS